MRYWPALSEVADRTRSISAGLDASTVTPGITAPELSRTVPAMVCAPAADAVSRSPTTTNIHRARLSIATLLGRTTTA
jgi:hypothetical protein